MTVISRQDRFPQAAGRHLRDAEILESNGRLDNAVYLAGYTVECSLKTLLSHHLGARTARHYRHDLVALETRGLQRLQVLLPHVDTSWPASVIQDTVLTDGHPVRRYWPSAAWSPSEVRTAVQRARDLYSQTVVSMVLDGTLHAEELVV